MRNVGGVYVYKAAKKAVDKLRSSNNRRDWGWDLGECSSIQRIPSSFEWTTFESNSSVNRSSERFLANCTHWQTCNGPTDRLKWISFFFSLSVNKICSFLIHSSLIDKFEKYKKLMKWSLRRGCLSFVI